MIGQSRVCMDLCKNDEKYKFYDGSSRCLETCESGRFRSENDDYKCINTSTDTCSAVLAVTVNGMRECVNACEEPNKYEEIDETLDPSIKVCASVCKSGYYYETNSSIPTCLRDSTKCPPDEYPDLKYALLTDIMYRCVSECSENWFLNGSQCVHTCSSYVVKDGRNVCQECTEHWYYEKPGLKRCVS